MTNSQDTKTSQEQNSWHPMFESTVATLLRWLLIISQISFMGTMSYLIANLDILKVSLSIYPKAGPSLATGMFNHVLKQGQGVIPHLSVLTLLIIGMIIVGSALYQGNMTSKPLKAVSAVLSAGSVILAAKIAEMQIFELPRLKFKFFDIIRIPSIDEKIEKFTTLFKETIIKAKGEKIFEIISQAGEERPGI
jgi:hypothetical protein